MTRPREIDGIQSVSRAAHSAFISMDEAGVITFWNPAAERIFGWSSDEVVGRAVADVIIPEEVRGAHWKGLRGFLETGSGPVLDRMVIVEGLHRSGRRVPLELTITSLQLATGWTFHAYLRDITERMRADSTANEAVVHASLLAARAAEYERALVDYESLMRHRIGNPLTVIMGAAHTLRDVPELAEDSARRLIGMIIDAANQLEAVTLKAAPVTPEEVDLGPRPRSPTEQLVAIEEMFRSVNAEIVGTFEVSMRLRLPLVCECSDAGCARVLYVTREQYEQLRSSVDQFAMLPGHEHPRIDVVLEQQDGYCIVARRA